MDMPGAREAAALLRDFRFVGPTWEGKAFLPFWGSELDVSISPDDEGITPRQLAILHEQVNRAVHVVDPEDQRNYVLLSREEYERMEALLAKESAPAPSVNGVKPGMRAAQEAYWRDLPELLKLKSPKRQWVAYHGQQRIGFASTDGELYRKCERRGIPKGEFYVDRLEPREFPPWAEEVIECNFETEPPPSPTTSS